MTISKIGCPNCGTELTLDLVLREQYRKDEERLQARAAQAEAPTPSAKGTGVPYELLGESYVASNAMEAAINIILYFVQYDDNFYWKLAPKVRGRTRNHIAPSRLEVYPGRPDLARYVKEISPGWFIGCNIANREKKKFLRAACEVMGITFGQDLKIDLPERLIGVPIAA